MKMITKISNLERFGIFDNFSWDKDLPEFRRFNLIYGWNRSGKTTLSRIFASCEKKCLYDENDFSQYPKEGKFKILVELDKGKSIPVKSEDIESSDLSIRVFSQDFVDGNISFDPSESCIPIVIGEESIKAKKELDSLTEEKDILSRKLVGYQRTQKDKIAIRDNFLADLGREIANVINDKTQNKKKVIDEMERVGIDNFSDKVLTNEEVKEYREICVGGEDGKKKEWLLLDPLKVCFLFDGERVDNFQKISETGKKLLERKVISEVLERLKSDSTLNSWVKQGFELHKSKGEKEKCMFCEKPLEKDFLQSLSGHFSRDYDTLREFILQFKNNIAELERDILNPDDSGIYPDLADNYRMGIEKLNKIIEGINEWINPIIIKLEEKYNNPLKIMDVAHRPENFLAEYNRVVEEINRIIIHHNEKVKNHSTEVQNARKKLNLHLIAVALSEHDYGQMEKDVSDSETRVGKMEERLAKIAERVSELMKKSEDIGKAIGEINKHLKAFFGENAIELELDKTRKGYIIKRDGLPAKNLSEGEKTAIAFSYFIVKTGERSFNKSRGIIFIDDPISSFDSNYIYHCFSLIKCHFGEAKQLFVSTHSSQLFSLVKNWLTNKNKRYDEDRRPCRFFMIESFTEQNGSRKSRIVKLDKTLLDHKSEYLFLFAKLKSFLDSESAEYGDLYTIGNVARRFLDIYLDLKIPNAWDQKAKMDRLIENINESEVKIDPVSAEKTYSIMNAFSHNSDPMSMIEHNNKGEIKDAVRILFNIIKESDPQHFRSLED